MANDILQNNIKIVVDWEDDLNIYIAILASRAVNFLLPPLNKGRVGVG